ncbi:hypothetical protein EON63_25380 [archaeon]|nr:MAG: hypothetical protein EON63_25380 [archaeon]
MYGTYTGRYGGRRSMSVCFVCSIAVVYTWVLLYVYLCLFACGYWVCGYWCRYGHYVCEHVQL